MEISHIVSFAAIASFLVISPGPSGLLIFKTVPNCGMASGFANIAGFLAAFCLHGAMSILGVSVLLAKSILALSIVKYLGAAYLCWIGLKALFEAIRPVANATGSISRNPKKTFGNSFSEGFFTNALNPKILIFYLAMFPHFLPSGDGAVSMALMLVGLHSALSTIWFSGLVLLLSQMRPTRFCVPFQPMLNGVAGTVFIGIGIKYSAILA